MRRQRTVVISHDTVVCGWWWNVILTSLNWHTFNDVLLAAWDKLLIELLYSSVLDFRESGLMDGWWFLLYMWIFLQTRLFIESSTRGMISNEARARHTTHRRPARRESWSLYRVAEMDPGPELLVNWREVARRRCAWRVCNQQGLFRARSCCGILSCAFGIYMRCEERRRYRKMSMSF